MGDSTQKREYCLIGLSKFNLAVGKILMRDGHQVTAVDIDEKKVNQYGDMFTYTVVCDATNIKALESVDMKHFDYVVLGVSEVGSSILIAANLKELDIQNILCKAKDESHKRILKFLGITNTYIPEEEIAPKVSYKLIHDLNVDAFTTMQNDADTICLKVPLNNSSFLNKQIKDVDFIKKSAIILISITRADGKIVSPVNGKDEFMKGDVICLICNKKDIIRVKSNFESK
ncbi:uncharacterized protein MG323-like [Rattus rattus]|uniref:uncharacterized protein MG323-like n=1 Tax=Rattus rattus TaxID=10117 RepID=UPI0013F30A19|nr:uncharacterized protein MG323-like [Rattus rattus]